MKAGGIRCWGYNKDGQLGNGTVSDQSTNHFLLTPTAVSGISSGVLSIATGIEHTCALLSPGSVKCWGNNFAGAIGDGTTTDRYVPTDLVFGIEAIDYLAAVPMSQTGQIDLATGYGLTIMVQSYTQGAHGAVSCTAAGLCTYSPESSYAGPDAFQYTASVGVGGGAAAISSIEAPAAVVTGTVNILVARSFVHMPLVKR